MVGLDDTTDRDRPRFPEHGADADTVLADLAALHTGDIDWRGGRSFSLVYNPDDAELERALHGAAELFLHENGLNPFKYPSLVQVESDIVAWAADLFHTHPRAGTMSSGGTESIFLAVHTAREHARMHRGITTANIVTSETAHPAFAKACHYLDLEMRRAPARPDGRADLDAMEALVDDHTILLVGSAPNYPFGVIDPIPEIAGLAAQRGILCHVDGCLGGWMLPWWERLGEPVPPWDFRVEGVTSLSADIHKYGYTFKGASTVLYRDPDMVQHQWFVYDDWPGGLYGSVTTAGTRPAAPMVGAWAAVRFLGVDGYLAKARQVRDATRGFLSGIEAIDGLRLVARPDLSVFCFTSDVHDIGAIGDVMDDRGWNLDRQPSGLHAMLSPYHVHVVDRFCTDLADAVASHGESRGKAAGYGGIAT